MKLLTILGARPRFIKAAAISRAIRQYGENGQGEPIGEMIVHTVRHFDENISAVFFAQLDTLSGNATLGNELESNFD